MCKKESKLWQVAGKESNDNEAEEAGKVVGKCVQFYVKRFSSALCSHLWGQPSWGGVFSQLNGFKFEFYLLMREESVR